MTPKAKHTHHSLLTPFRVWLFDARHPEEQQQAAFLLSLL